MSIATDKVIIQNRAKRNKSIDEDGEEMKVTMETFEYRLVPVMFGAVLMTTSLFWIGWTAVYVRGSMMILVSAAKFGSTPFPHSLRQQTANKIK